jgi:hypothetical protein
VFAPTVIQIPPHKLNIIHQNQISGTLHGSRRVVDHGEQTPTLRRGRNKDLQTNKPHTIDECSSWTSGILIKQYELTAAPQLGEMAKGIGENGKRGRIPTTSVHQQTAETVAPSCGVNPKQGTGASSTGLTTNTLLSQTRPASQNRMTL